MKTYGSGQTAGAPLAITATTPAAAQTIHTAPAGAGTPNLVTLYGQSLDGNAHPIIIALYNASAVLVATFKAVVHKYGRIEPLLASGGDREDLVIPVLPLNGTMVVKAYCPDGAGLVAVTSVVDDQGSSAGIVSAPLFSGLIAAVQNASRYGMGTGIGGVGTATIADGQVMAPRAGSLSGLVAIADAAVGGGATVTVSVFKNGVATDLTLTLANADGTTVKASTGGAVAVAQGDLITFGVVTNNAGAPAANIQASCLFQ